MKEHLNTLFVTTEGAYLAKSGAAVAVRIERKTRLQIPLLNLDGIVCIGRVGASPSLLGACADAGVRVSFLSRSGRLLASVVGFTPGNVLLRKAQFAVSESEPAWREIARSIVIGKIINSRHVLARSARDAQDPARADRLREAVRRLETNLLGARRAASGDSLRGVEGEAAATYFAAFDDVLHGDPSFRFGGRTRRPPQDPVNALLSFLYVLLMHDVRSACEAVGLDSQVGFLHRDRPGRPSLALDLMEEFRPVLCDRLAATLINRRQVEPTGFRRMENGAVWMDDDVRRKVIAAWQERKAEVVEHPFLGEKATIGLIVHLQARLLARHLRGDLDAYPPMLWK